MVLNKRLTVMQTLLGFQGRIGRLRFLAFNCLVVVLFVPLFMVMVAIAQEFADKTSTLGHSAAETFLLWLFATWAGSALLAKRLHDIERSGLHAIWIVALWYIPSTIFPDGIAVLWQLISVAVSLCLLLIPGTEGPNHYGLTSGMMFVDQRTLPLMQRQEYVRLN